MRLLEAQGSVGAREIAPLVGAMVRRQNNEPMPRPETGPGERPPIRERAEAMLHSRRRAIERTVDSLIGHLRSEETSPALVTPVVIRELADQQGARYGGRGRGPFMAWDVLEAAKRKIAEAEASSVRDEDTLRGYRELETALEVALTADPHGQPGRVARLLSEGHRMHPLDPLAEGEDQASIRTEEARCPTCGRAY
jgi:hypothetical protein